MAANFNSPALPNQISGDLQNIKDTLNALAQLRPDISNTTYPASSVRIVKNNESGRWEIQQYNGSAWAVMKYFGLDAQYLRGFVTSTTAQASTIPVYDAQSRLVGNITGNAPTASRWQNKLTLDIGGVVAANEIQFNGSETTKQTINVTTLYLNNVTDDAVTGTLTKAHGGTGNTTGTAEDVSFTHAGQTLSAKAYGQIGTAKVIVTKTNADSITMPGTYICQAQYVVNPDNGTTVLKWPEDSSKITFLRVYAQGVYIYQDWILSARTWRRYSENTGSSWSGWECLSSTYRTSFNIYISESGSDANSGLDSRCPVKTFSKALRIADAQWHGLDDGGITFCFSRITGTYSHGTIVIQNKPYVARLAPYDGSTHLGSVEVAPIFDNIYVYGCLAQTAMIKVKGLVTARFGGVLLLAKGRQTVGRFYIYQNGAVIKDSENSEQNVIIFEPDANNALGDAFTIFDGGSFNFSSYAYIGLNATNATGGQFLFVARGGSFRFIKGNLKFRQVGTSAGTYTGRRYYLQAGSSVTTNSTGLDVAALNAIFPGTTPEVQNGAVINGIPVGVPLNADVVHKTGDETIAGTKTFSSVSSKQIQIATSSVPAINTYMYGYTPGTNPSSAAIMFQRVNAVGAKAIAYNRSWVNTDGSNVVDIGLGRWDASDTSFHWFQFVRKKDNVSYLYIPTNPSDTDGLNNIGNNHAATCYWVRRRIAEAIAGTGLQLKGTYICSSENATASGALSDNYKWTLTGLTVDKPVFIMSRFMFVGSAGASLEYSKSPYFNQGAQIVTIYDSDAGTKDSLIGGASLNASSFPKLYYSIGGSYITSHNSPEYIIWQPGSNVYCIVPLKTSVTLWIYAPKAIVNGNLYAYQ